MSFQPSTKASRTSLQPKRTRTKPPPAEPVTKQSQLIGLLKSPAGATIDQMTQATGWQPHTVRGTISGALRKRLGLDVQCAAPVDGGSRVYRIVAAA